MNAAAAHARRHRFGEASRRNGLPAGLLVEERAPGGGWEAYRDPVVVLVHGSLDRAASFARAALRLSEVALVSYDRRGYQGSRAASCAEGLRTHVDDLLSVSAAYAGERPVVAVGHSVGGTVVVGAAVTAPGLFAAVGAYEPSMPWLGFHRLDPGPRPQTGAPRPDPEAEAERFFRRMVGDDAWDRLPEAQRASRRADGPALVTDLRGIRGAAPYEVTDLRVPAIVASGGAASFPHHRQTAEWLAEHVPAVRWTQIPDAGHGAHLSHPDAFADLVREVMALGALPAACG